MTVLQGLRRYGNDKPLDALKCLPYSIRMFWIHAYQSYVWNKMATQRLKLGRTPLLGDLYLDSKESDKIKVVTDASSVSLSQIVLPLSGYNVRYPLNSVGEMYTQFLEKEEGITFKKKVSDESTPKGAYRRLIALPKSFEWEKVQTQNVPNDEFTVETAIFKFSLCSGSLMG